MRVLCVLLLTPFPARAGGDLLPTSIVTAPLTGMELVRIPGGEFVMGSGEGHVDERPGHSVRLKSFFLGRYEVTQGQWRVVMGTEPSRHAGCDDCPVDNVSWNDVQEFLRMAPPPPGLRLRLPTEAEWEYAARGGSAHRRWPGTDEERYLPEFAWYSGAFGGRTRPAGLKEPNAFSLHDMAGNVAEWCLDWYGADYYRASPSQSPGGPVTGTRRTVRGGSWLSGPGDMAVSRRGARAPGTRSPAVGFRVAAESDGPRPDSGPLPGPR